MYIIDIVDLYTHCNFIVIGNKEPSVKGTFLKIHTKVPYGLAQSI